jgi:hypothetical protein
MVAVVIDVPATSGDPHQVSDGRYYRRHNFNRLIMEHYEVREAMRRAVDPDLVLNFDLPKGQAAYASLDFREFSDLSDPFDIDAILINRSNQPAMYTALSVYVDQRVEHFRAGPFLNTGGTTIEQGHRHLLTMTLGVNAGLPVFKEMPTKLGSFAIRVKTRLLGSPLALGYVIRSPGCFKEAHGHIETGQSGQLHLKMPK